MLPGRSDQYVFLKSQGQWSDQAKSKVVGLWSHRVK